MEVEREEKKERETVATERVNTNAAGKADVKRVARWRGGSVAGRGETDGESSFLLALGF